MSNKHPYTSGSGGIVHAVNQLRSTLPQQVLAETLKKLGIAPNNETYIINILRFVGVIDEKGQTTPEAKAAFTKHLDDEFQAAFSTLVETAYSDLFKLHGAGTWKLPADKLISYFRNTDHTSAIVGQRQANTFQTLAGLAGHLDVQPAKAPTSAPKKASNKSSKVSVAKSATASDLKPQAGINEGKQINTGGRDVGLTVRIEINLPLAPDQQTYDRIFKSIKENLING